MLSEYDSLCPLFSYSPRKPAAAHPWILVSGKEWGTETGAAALFRRLQPTAGFDDTWVPVRSPLARLSLSCEVKKATGSELIMSLAWPEALRREMAALVP